MKVVIPIFPESSKCTGDIKKKKKDTAFEWAYYPLYSNREPVWIALTGDSLFGGLGFFLSL